MNPLWVFLLFTALPLPLVTSNNNDTTPANDDLDDLAKSIASDLGEEQVEKLDEALYEGFVHGVALSFDYVSFGKQSSAEGDATDSDDDDNKDKKDDHDKQQEREKEHENNLTKAEFEADYLTRHRPLESTEVDESESDIYSLFNLLIHYMTSRSQPWRLVEPRTENLTDGTEHHMVFISDSSNTENRHIPRNMILSVGNIAKTLPQKKGKSPVLLTCLETFIVSKLVFNLMTRLLESSAPIDLKLKYIDRWIHLAQNHFVLYLPYITITAQRCFDLLDDNGVIKGDFDSEPYRNLRTNCQVIVKKRDEESDLQTFVMLDSELHGKLIERCIEQKHIIPSLLEEKETHLRRIHNVLDKEMSWETFSNAMNMVLADVEKDILKHDDYLMRPGTWGCGLSRKEADAAERKLIASFAKTHVQLNLKVRSTIIALNRVISDASNDNGSSLAKTFLQFVEHEQRAAVEEAETNEELSKCMKDAKEKFTEEARRYHDSGSSNGSLTKEAYTEGIAIEMRKYHNEGWMPCMSARIMDTIASSCESNPHYCKVLLEILRDEIGKLEPDSTSALIMENFHNVVCVALLKNKEITAENLRSYLGRVSRNELKEVNSLGDGKPSGGS